MDPAASSAGAGLAAAASWGAGDFAGGYAARRTPALRVALVVQAVGLVLLVVLALALREPLPPARDLAWGAAAGLSGIGGLLALYGALASGRMGIAAPVTGVVAAILPVAVGLALEGAPHPLRYVGFALALAGIALVSGERGATTRRALALALLAGLGFGGFLVFIAQTSGAAFLWPLVAVRVAGGALAAALLLARPRGGGTAPVWLLLTAGLLDTGGNVFFLLASRLGRLDVAAVLSSLYPAATVLLARVVLRERLTRVQVAGAIAMLAAIVAIGWPMPSP